jgi:cell division protein ZapD
VSNNIIYEQPLNEAIRICLRLEYLFSQTLYLIENQDDSFWNAHLALKSLLESIGLVERPDLKNKLGQLLNQYLGILSQLDKSPAVDQQKLRETITRLERAVNIIHEGQGRFGESLRNNEFLFAIQQRIYTPAGTACFNLPGYHLWLKQSSKDQKQMLQEWFSDFKLLKEVVDLLLELTRESSSFKTRMAKGGFYQTALDPQIAYQIVRILVPIEARAYPEISVGKYLITIHFFELNVNGRAKQIGDELAFDLALGKF